MPFYLRFVHPPSPEKKPSKTAGIQRCLSPPCLSGITEVWPPWRRTLQVCRGMWCDRVGERDGWGEVGRQLLWVPGLEFQTLRRNNLEHGNRLMSFTRGPPPPKHREPYHPFIDGSWFPVSNLVGGGRVEQGRELHLSFVAVWCVLVGRVMDLICVI